MPQLNIPSDSSQRKVIKAFMQIGFVGMPLGKGSHQMMHDPKTGARVTIQYKIYKNIIRKYCKTVEKLGYDVDEFIKKL